MNVRIQRSPDSFGVYLLLLSLVSALFILALGPGLYSSGSFSYTQGSYRFFNMLCHQDPARSYLLNNIPMAVCSRCIGIYGGALAGTLLLYVSPLVFGSSEKLPLYLFGIFTFLNLLDIVGNNFHLWTNTLTSRLFFGILFGMGTILILNNTFFKQGYTEIKDGK